MCVAIVLLILVETLRSCTHVKQYAKRYLQGHICYQCFSIVAHDDKVLRKSVDGVSLGQRLCSDRMTGLCAYCDCVQIVAVRMCKVMTTQ